MVEPRELPDLGERFDTVCTSSQEACLKMLLENSARRESMYEALVDRNRSLVEFIRDLVDQVP